MQGPQIVRVEQLITKTVSLAIDEMRELISKLDPGYKIVLENYRVYGWKSEDHSWSELHTSQMIGAIKAICDYEDRTPPIMRMASDAKNFVTDEKLKAWGMYHKGLRHGRDATRHAIFSQVFDK